MTAPAFPASADPVPDLARAAAAATGLPVSSRAADADATGRSDPARAAASDATDLSVSTRAADADGMGLSVPARAPAMGLSDPARAAAAA